MLAYKKAYDDIRLSVIKSNEKKLIVIVAGYMPV